MPPKGYETVTLPNDVVELIDERVDPGPYESRADALRSLLEPNEVRASARVEVIEDKVLEDIAGRVAARTADEVEGRMR